MGWFCRQSRRLAVQIPWVFVSVGSRKCGRTRNAHFRVGLCQLTAVSRGSCSNNSITLSVTVARTIVGLPETDQPEVCAGSFSGMAGPELMSVKFKVSRVWYAYP